MSDKYARIEWERRFLLACLPPDLDQAAYQLIEDIYITGTRLRLRRMSSPQGETLALKLGQKYLRDEQAAQQTVMTNFYLSEAEFTLLRLLPGTPLTKRRYPYRWQGHRYSIDQFCGRLEGLILAEIEATTEEALLALPVPAFAVREVTDDIAYTGGYLVQ